jgi:hypothetical protein
MILAAQLNVMFLIYEGVNMKILAICGSPRKGNIHGCHMGATFTFVDL